MKKKLFVVLLVTALVLTSLSAKDSGFKVGGNLGWGIDYFKVTPSSDSSKSATSYLNNGFAFGINGEYDFNKNFGVKVSGDMMIAGKTKSSVKSSGSSGSTTSSERAGLYWDLIIDAKYTKALDKKWSLSGLAGFELLGGYLAKSGSENVDKYYKNLGMGINIGGEAQYKVSKNVYINGGLSASMLFINSNKLKDTFSDKLKFVNFYIRPYVGVDYAF